MALMQALGQSDEFEVFIVTDMNQKDAAASLKKTRFHLNQLDSCVSIGTSMEIRANRC